MRSLSITTILGALIVLLLQATALADPPKVANIGELTTSANEATVLIVKLDFGLDEPAFGIQCDEGDTSHRVSLNVAQMKTVVESLEGVLEMLPKVGSEALDIPIRAVDITNPGIDLYLREKTGERYIDFVVYDGTSSATASLKGPDQKRLLKILQAALR